MFALIISIIAIALVVALAGATLYYGGDAFTQGNARSTAAALVNQGQQISGAWTVYEADHGGASPAALDDLAPVGGELKYLAAIPTAPVEATWTLGSGSATVELTGLDSKSKPLISDEVCEAVGKLPGAGGVFSCAVGVDDAANTFTYNL